MGEATARNIFASKNHWTASIYACSLLNAAGVVDVNSFVLRTVKRSPALRCPPRGLKAMAQKAT